MFNIKLSPDSSGGGASASSVVTREVDIDGEGNSFTTFMKPTIDSTKGVVFGNSCLAFEDMSVWIDPSAKKGEEGNAILQIRGAQEATYTVGEGDDKKTKKAHKSIPIMNGNKVIGWFKCELYMMNLSDKFADQIAILFQGEEGARIQTRDNNTKS